MALACAGLLLAALLHGTSALGAAGWAAYPVLVAGAFGAIVAWPSALLSRGAAVRPLAALGRISYSAYLYHLPLLLAFNAAVGTALGGAGVLAWTGTVVAVAWASHRWVEEPYLRGGGDRARPLAFLAHRRDPGAK